MSLDVDVPEPPSLDGPRSQDQFEAVVVPEDDEGDDYRREEVAGFLESGAWRDAFEEWTEETDLTTAEFDLVLEWGLIEALDFYWDPATDQVGYRSPALSPERADRDFGDADVDVDLIETELDTLGRIVSEVLENDYVLRDEESFGFFSEEYTGEDSSDRT